MLNNKTVVYTSGTFDMLHINHLKMIEYARALGDILIVGVNTDELVASYCIFVAPFEAKNKQELNAEVIGRVSDVPCGYELIRHSQRLCRLLSLNAPELVVKNEARMLFASLAIHMFGEKIEITR